MASVLGLQIVQQTTKASCVEEAATTGGGGGGGGGGGSDPADNDAHLCFMGDARVTLADSSTIALKDASMGDQVWTGSGVGRVTKVLVHPVNKMVPVTVVNTKYGELVGTQKTC